ncbi:hypothetical protein [Vibrio phage vB_VhaS-a]|nr:hypothetical protein [Vibrio phage vB_VhaS-a]
MAMLSLSNIKQSRAKLDALESVGIAFDCPVEIRHHIHHANEALKLAERTGERADVTALTNHLTEYGKRLDRAIASSGNCKILDEGLKDLVLMVHDAPLAFPEALTLNIVLLAIGELEDAHAHYQAPTQHYHGVPPAQLLHDLEQYHQTLRVLRDHLKGHLTELDGEKVVEALKNAPKQAIELIAENGSDHRLRDCCSSILKAFV